MAGLSARARNQRAESVAAISRANGSRREMAASRFSAGVTIAVLVRGVTTSTSSGRASGARRRSIARRMAVPPGPAAAVGPSRAAGRGRRALTDLEGPQDGVELLDDRRELGARAALPGPAGELFGEGDRRAGRPADQAAVGEQGVAERGALFLLVQRGEGAVKTHWRPPSACLLPLRSRWSVSSRWPAGRRRAGGRRLPARRGAARGRSGRSRPGARGGGSARRVARQSAPPPPGPPRRGRGRRRRPRPGRGSPAARRAALCRRG